MQYNFFKKLLLVTFARVLICYYFKSAAPLIKGLSNSSLTVAVTEWDVILGYCLTGKKGSHSMVEISLNINNATFPWL